MTSKPDLCAQVVHFHAIWNAVTGQELQLRLCDYEREFGYHQFIKAGFTEADIHTVVRYLRRKVKEGTRLEGSLRWSNCIGNLCRFEEDLSMAKAEARNAKPPPSAKERVLEQARPTAVVLKPEATQITAKPIGALIEELKKAAGMRI